MAARWRGRVALVTGASAGIGYSVAKALVERGMKVVGCARNVGKTEELSKELKGQGQPGSLTALTCDVSKEDQVVSMFQRIRQDPGLGRVDVCINNAALSHVAPLLSGKHSHFRNMFEVNVLGLLMCSQESFKLMQDNNIDDGHIILVNSISALFVPPIPPFHCYSATKFAVNAIREGIRQELRERESHIRISQVCPGGVETEFAERMFGPEDAKKITQQSKMMPAEAVTSAILYILDTPPHVEVNDITIRHTGSIV